MKTCIAVVLLVASLLNASAVLALDIIYPADKTVVGLSDFFIVKAGEKPALDALVITINGVASDPIDIGSAEYKAAFRDMLILQPEWDKGKNQVQVTGFSGGKEQTSARADIYYLPSSDPVAIVPPGYKRFVMHLPEKEALCAPCHNMKPDKAQLRAATAESNPCAGCHKRLLAKKYVHGPDGVFQCTDCHDGATKPARWGISKPMLTLCGECHTDKVTEFKKNAFVHGPVGVGDCTVCHDSHASDFPAQLHAETNSLCTGCHADVAKTQHVLRGVGGKGHPLAKVGDPLRPGQQLNCSSCHNPHGGANQYFFVRNAGSRFTLCALCHKK